MPFHLRVVASSVVSAIVAANVGCSSAPEKERLGIDRSADTAEYGYCRTKTCPPPAQYPLPGACEPEDWSASKTCRDLGASGAPLWWRSACVGYALDRSASAYVPYDDVARAVTSAFSAWTDATCTNDSASAPARVSLDVKDLGPVDCSRATFSRTGPNQNVITFHDDVWPYETSDRRQSGAAVSPVIALTTVSFDADGGEIIDADVEINTADHAVLSFDGLDFPPSRAYDLQAVLTHELGHFLGLAHSPDREAVMNATGDADMGGRNEPKRELRDVDVAGICAIYPPGDRRNVSTLVDASGHIGAGACDPTPRRGFATTCE